MQLRAGAAQHAVHDTVVRVLGDVGPDAECCLCVVVVVVMVAVLVVMTATATTILRDCALSLFFC